jgi:hypothetical protein
MSFPLNPVNGQETTQNSIVYSYASATNSWRRVYNNVLDQLYIGGNYPSISTTTGALIVVGGVGIGKDLNVGGKIYSQFAEVITTSTIGDWAVTEVNPGVDISVTTATGGIVTVNNISTLQSITNRGNTTTNQLLVFNSTNASNTQSGALVVSGGVGVGGNAYIGGSVYASTGTFLDIVITGNENAISTVTGSLQVQGGIGISESLFVKNTQLSSYRSSVISTNSTQNLDTFSTSTFRSIRYFIQIVDVTKIHITEMTLFHDNTLIYKNEYGISTNAGELGSFDASIAGGIATLTFVPNYTPTQMVITMSRLAIIP